MKEDSAKDELSARIDDMCALAGKRSRPMFSAFLNDREQFTAEKQLTNRKDIGFMFWGGNKACTRKMLCVYPDGKAVTADDFPIYSLTVSYRKADKLGHRDFLGSFMALGIERETVGDIFVGEGAAAVFCNKTAHDMITDCIVRIGKVGASVSEGLTPQSLECVTPPEYREMTVNVASERADCIISGITGMSREKSAAFIRGGSFMLNYVECDNISKTVSDGDVLTLRGYGKFIVSGDASVTKKGRQRITVKKYS